MVSGAEDVVSLSASDVFAAVELVAIAGVDVVLGLANELFVASDDVCCVSTRSFVVSVPNVVLLAFSVFPADVVSATMFAVVPGTTDVVLPVCLIVESWNDVVVSVFLALIFPFAVVFVGFLVEFLVFGVVVAFVVLVLVFASVVPVVCSGDCDGDVDEVTGVDVEFFWSELHTKQPNTHTVA